MKNLLVLDNFFNGTVFVQKNFIKGKVKGDLGITNNKFTLCFININSCFRPKSLLDKNRLDKSRKILKANVKIINRK